MQSFPYSYTVFAAGSASGPIAITAPNHPALPLANHSQAASTMQAWSPELLLLASASNCYVLAFRSLAYVSKLEWRRVECKVIGEVDRADGIVRFTRITTHVTLTVPSAASEELCRRVLRKAERMCLVANSLRATRDIVTHVVRDASH